MLATTAAAGLPFVEVKDAKLGTSVTTNTHAFGTGSATAPLPAAPALVKRPSHSTLPPPTLSSHSALSASIPRASGSQARRRRGRGARAGSPALAKSLVFSAWDWLWRQWYALIATWGISVMEPWERVFTLVLLGALVALFGVALVKTPAYVQYALKRLAYYLFGSHSRRSIATTAAGAAAGGANQTAAWLHTLSAASPVERADQLAQCQQALAGLVGLNASNAGDSARLVRAWSQAS